MNLCMSHGNCLLSSSLLLDGKTQHKSKSSSEEFLQGFFTVVYPFPCNNDIAPLQLTVQLIKYTLPSKKWSCHPEVLMLLLRPLIDSAALISSCKAFQSLGTLTGKCSGTSCLKPKSSLHQKAGIRCLLILHVCIFTTTFHSFEATVGWLKSQFGDLHAESYPRRKKSNDHNTKEN